MIEEAEADGFGPEKAPPSSDAPDYPRVVELERVVLSLTIEREEAKRALAHLRKAHEEVSKRADAASIEATLYREGAMGVAGLLRSYIMMGAAGSADERARLNFAAGAWLGKMGLSAPMPIAGDPTFEPIRHETRPVDLSTPLGTFGFPKQEGEK